ncbi:DUF2752 domain-containing protein [Marivirga sp. S37H4]|uniref:DUF2752 domain-containing protein n=1 Tax=Marivirga aurantiaca TaxID=2802615 RepID=A0A934WXM8_9BACT|nr:DUF2752 domain-containing protein [Marivirga aurantiaca]MBK6265034.1 DUF2752 domain-containing protein [Marivirga aurantiaca]
MKKKSFYILISAMSLISYGWLFFNVQAFKKADIQTINVCFFKNVTSIPCPACGTTTSVVSLLEGEFEQAIMKNPLGIVAAILLLIVPIWLLKDLILQQSSLHTFYIQFENFLRQKYIATSLFAILLVNWVWNILKEL